MCCAILVATHELCRRSEPLTFDCVTVLVAREGSLVVHDQRPHSTPRPEPCA